MASRRRKLKIGDVIEYPTGGIGIVVCRKPVREGGVGVRWISAPSQDYFNHKECDFFMFRSEESAIWLTSTKQSSSS